MNHRNIPLGYAVSNGNITINEAEADTVREIAERNKYYIENNHPAIIDAGTFARVQEEIARRSGKPKVKQKGKLVRQIIECIVVESKEKIKVVFIGGTEIEMAL